MTVADVNAVLIALSEVVVDHLREGRHVQINGLGYLQVTLQCPPVQSTKEIRAESIHFKSVAFRPEAELKRELKTMTVERTQTKVHSFELTFTQIDQLLTKYFSEHEHLTRSSFQQLCGLARTTANRRLQTLLKEGKIKNIGYRRAPIYVPEEGYYEK